MLPKLKLGLPWWLSTLAWKIPWMEEPGRLQSMGSLRVGHDWVTSLSLFTSCIGEGKGNPLQCSCLENPRDGGAWWAAIYGVAQSQTRLKWLSISMVAQMVQNLPAMLETWAWSQSWEDHWLPTPVFWPGECHGQRSLASYNPWASLTISCHCCKTIVFSLNNRYSYLRFCFS